MQPLSSRHSGHAQQITTLAGGGHNNHRDWEALLAGAIPLVDHDPQLSGMWDDLPVVQVRNWSEVTPRYLRATWHTMRDRQYNLAKVYFPYWLHASLSAD